MVCLIVHCNGSMLIELDVVYWDINKASRYAIYYQSKCNYTLWASTSNLEDSGWQKLGLIWLNYVS